MDQRQSRDRGYRCRPLVYAGRDARSAAGGMAANAGASCRLQTCSCGVLSPQPRLFSALTEDLGHLGLAGPAITAYHARGADDDLARVLSRTDCYYRGRNGPKEDQFGLAQKLHSARHRSKETI